MESNPLSSREQVLRCVVSNSILSRLTRKSFLSVANTKYITDWCALKATLACINTNQVQDKLVALLSRQFEHSLQVAINECSKCRASIEEGEKEGIARIEKEARFVFARLVISTWLIMSTKAASLL